MESHMITGFWGLSAEAWTAVGTLILALATAVLVAVGVYQIRSIRMEEKRTRTLAACDRYDRDDVLYLCLKELARAKRDGSFDKDPAVFRPEVATLLNYLDSLAVGIAQGLYIEELARDHVEPILKRHVAQFLTGDMPQKITLDAANYACLTDLCKKWSNAAPRYRESNFWFKRRS